MLGVELNYVSSWFGNTSITKPSSSTTSIFDSSSTVVRLYDSIMSSFFTTAMYWIE